LSIGRLAVGAESYYVGAVAGSEDYYVGSGEAPGQWTGTGSQLLGLSGQVSAADLRAVLAGLDPATAERLTSRTHKVPGFDVTLSEPKSVSLLWAFGGEDVSAKVSAAHDAAVSAALGYLEAEACRVRLGDGGTRSVPGQGIVVAGFGHRVSRAGDPQVHTHLLLANLARSDDGKWRSIDSRRLYRMGRTAGFASGMYGDRRSGRRENGGGHHSSSGNARRRRQCEPHWQTRTLESRASTGRTSVTTTSAQRLRIDSDTRLPNTWHPMGRGGKRTTDNKARP